MSTVTVPTPVTTVLPATVLPTDWTLADLRRHVGDVPLNRIRLYPPPGMATEEDAAAIHREDGAICELVDGILVEKAMGAYESVLATILIQAIRNFLDKHPLGVVLGEAGTLRILPKRMRIPDVCFIRWERFPARKLPREAVPAVAPDLAIEILSPSNTRKEMQLKLKEYFTAGTRLVWYIDPERKRATIYTSPTDAEEIEEKGVLDGRDVLPGFKLKLKELFARAPRA